MMKPAIVLLAAVAVVALSAGYVQGEEDPHNHPKSQREEEHDQAHAECHLQLVVVSEWENDLEDGYAATVTVTAPGAAAGELDWTFQGSEAVLRVWDANYKQDGELFTAVKKDLKSHAGSNEFAFALQVALDQGELARRIAAAEEAGLSSHAAFSPIDAHMGPRACMITPFRMNLDSGLLNKASDHPEGPSFNPANRKEYERLRMKATKYTPSSGSEGEAWSWTRTVRDNALAVVGTGVSLVAVVAVVNALRSESTAAKARALMSETRYRIARLSVSSANAPLRFRTDSVGLSKKSDDDGTFLPLTSSPGDSMSLPSSMHQWNGPSASTTRARTPSMSQHAPPTYSA